MLRKNFFNAEELAALVKDYRNAGLSEEEVAIMSFARKITLHAHKVGVADYNELRGFGLTDDEILDIVLASAARNFIGRVMDALGMKPDASDWEFEPWLVQVLAVDR